MTTADPSLQPEQQKRYLLRVTFNDECYEQVLNFDPYPAYLEGDLGFSEMWELADAPDLDDYGYSLEEILADMTVECEEVEED